jgi:hypothetical protein
MTKYLRTGTKKVRTEKKKIHSGEAKIEKQKNINKAKWLYKGQAY